MRFSNFLSLFFVLPLGFGLVVGCGGSGGPDAVANLSTAPGLFDSPDGTVTTSNVTEAVNDSLEFLQGKSANVGGINIPNGLQLGPRTIGQARAATFEDCVTTEDNVTTTDYACLTGLDGLGLICQDGAGTVTDTKTEGLTTELAYDAVGFSCLAGAIVVSSCDITYTSTGGFGEGVTFCMEGSCTINSSSYNYGGGTCFQQGAEGTTPSVLVEAGEGAAVVGSHEVNVGCTELTTTITDATGDKTATCTVAAENQSCTSATDLVSVESCTLS